MNHPENNANKYSLKYSLFVSAVVGMTVSSTSMLMLGHYLPVPSISHRWTLPADGGRTSEKLANSFSVEYYRPTTSSKKEGTGLPVRLKIPVLNIDAAVEFVGLTADGVMDIPKGQDEVAWFEPGSRPGNIGSAVIAGHYGFKDKKPSAFDALYKLRKGDKVTVEDDEGATISFVVTRTRRYDPDQDASDVFGSGDGRSHLNLVTCEGEWDEKTQQYTKRLVVFTDRETQ